MNTKRTFLERALSSGMEVGLIAADDLLRHATPEVLASHLPKDLLAKLLKSCLAAPAMTPALVVETLGTVAMAANLPPEVIWGCVAEVAQRALGEAQSSGDKSSARDAKTSGKSSGSRSEAKPEPVPATKSEPVPAAKSGSSAKSGSTAKSVPVDAASVEAAPLPPVADAPRPKPNAKVRAKSKLEAEEPPRLPGVPRPGTDGDRASRARTAPIVPRSEFDVDTDVGENWDDDDDIVDIEEADAVGAVALDDPAFDWKGDDETLAKEPKR